MELITLTLAACLAGRVLWHLGRQIAQQLLRTLHQLLLEREHRQTMGEVLRSLPPGHGFMEQRADGSRWAVQVPPPSPECLPGGESDGFW